MICELLPSLLVELEDGMDESGMSSSFRGEMDIEMVESKDMKQ